MEGDRGIQLILGRPFLRDANARIDVGAGKISLRIMGRTMKFRFQNKRELFLIHEDSDRQGLWAEPGWKEWDIHHSPSEPAGKIGRFMIPQSNRQRKTKKSLTS